MWKDRVEHAKDIWAIYPGQTAHLTVRCMNALYRLQVMRGEAMSHLMALLEATKITLDNREELVVDLSQEMVEKDLQVEQLSDEIQELEELVGTRENTIEVLEDQLINTQQQLAEANEHLDCITRRSRIWGPTRTSISREERILPLAWTLLAQGDHLPPSRVLPRSLTRCQG
jgi:septal ring factor EnvC (AmiA/AmiB activator)